MAIHSENYNLRPAQNAALVTPSDSVALPSPSAKGLYIGGTGTLKVLTTQGSTVTFAAVPVGIFPLSVKQVFATGTTATNIIALY